MFTDKAQEVIDRSKDYAFSGGAAELAVTHLLAAVGKLPEPGVLLAQCFSMPVDALRAACPDLPDPVSCPGKLPLADRVRLILLYAKELADEVPDRYHPGMIDLRHLVAALAASPDACALLGLTPMLEDDASALVASWYETSIVTNQEVIFICRIKAIAW